MTFDITEWHTSCSPWGILAWAAGQSWVPGWGGSPRRTRLRPRRYSWDSGKSGSTPATLVCGTHLCALRCAGGSSCAAFGGTAAALWEAVRAPVPCVQCRLCPPRPYPPSPQIQAVLVALVSSGVGSAGRASRGSWCPRPHSAGRPHVSIFLHPRKPSSLPRGSSPTPTRSHKLMLVLFFNLRSAPSRRAHTRVCSKKCDELDPPIDPKETKDRRA